MALSRKDIEEITRLAMTDAFNREMTKAEYDTWALSNPVLPCNPNDPDFSSSPDGGPVACGTRNCSTPAATEQGYVHCKFCIEEMRVSQGESVEPVKSLADATIQVMKAQDDNWNGALNIIYGDEENEST